MGSNIPLEGGVHAMGFTAGPAGADKTSQALSYHIYSCGFADNNCLRNGDPEKTDCPLCDSYAADAVNTRDGEVQQLGGGVFITEFGACTDSAACLAEIDRVTKVADSHGHSWAYWQFKYFDDITTVSGPLESFYDTAGQLQQAKVKALSRTYAPAIAGRPKQVRFSAATGAFRLRYTANQAALPTEIFANEEWHYPTGHVMSAFNATVKSTGNHTMEATATAGAEVDIAITRPYNGSTSGMYTSVDGDKLEWAVSDDAGSGGFTLITGANLTWWKQLRVVGDDGQVVCTLQMQDSDHGPHSCSLQQQDQNSLLFEYSLEIWKAKFAGHHEKVDTISVGTFGPLMQKRLAFTWIKDD